VSKAVNIRVKFTNRQEAEADVLATDQELDIALLKVRETGDDFPYLKLTRKRPVQVGERAIVIGNPYGLSSSVTTGVISALKRNLTINNKVYANLIQTDAAINHGNSGGALLDGSGNLLGIVTAIYEEGKGIGFAIPIDDVISMLSEFLETEGKRPLLGIFIERRKEERSAYLSVNRIIPGSPAERYGLKVGDRIVEINKKKIKEGVKLSTFFRQATADGEVRCRISRGGEFYTVDIDMKDIQEYVPSPVEEKLCGMRLSDIRGYARLKFKVRAKNGVVVTRIYKGGIGERYGLRAGDVILKINNRETMDKEHFQSLMVEGLRRNYILYQVKRNGNIFLLPIKLDVLL
jgi:serine protease Do